VKRWAIVAAGAAGLLVVAAAVAARAVFARPLATFAWLGERALKAAGYEKTAVATPAGRLVVWRGGDGPPLVLLHGAGDRAAGWSRVAGDLARDHRVVVPDLAGHGRSEPREGPIRVEMLLDGIDALLAAEAGGRPAVLVGNSMGAWMAMLTARRHPEAVARVVAVNGGAIRGEEDVDLLPATRAEAYATLRLLRDPASPPVPAFVVDDIVRQARHGALARFAATGEEMGRWTLDGRLAEIAVPVELVWGESDRVMPLDYARRMLAELPHARLTTIPKCGHVPQTECPAAFLAALRTALAGSG